MLEQRLPDRSSSSVRAASASKAVRAPARGGLTAAQMPPNSTSAWRYPGDGAKDFRLPIGLPRLQTSSMIEPVRQRVSKRRTPAPALRWPLARHLQNAEMAAWARASFPGQMIAARRFAGRLPWRSTPVSNQRTTGERQHILRLTRAVPAPARKSPPDARGFHLPRSSAISIWLSFADHPFFTFKIGTEQRLYVLRQIRGFALRPDFGSRRSSASSGLASGMLNSGRCDAIRPPRARRFSGVISY